MVEGTWETGWEPLVERFAASVAQDGERGALCVMREGATLVDVWGGPGWQRDTLACCFSVTKGVLSILAHVMIARGMIGLDTRVADLWPDFAAEGKGAVTLFDLLTHRAGLPAVSGPVARGDLYDWDRMIAHLAASAPVVPLLADPVYHNMTYGHLLGEVLCRAAGVRPLSALLERLVTGPLAADVKLGMGPADRARAARMEQDDPQALWRALAEAPGTLFARSMAFFGEGEDFNTRRWQAAEIGSGSGHATARGLAVVYGQLVWRDALIPPARQAALRQERARGPGLDPILGIPLRLGEGLELSTPPGLDFGPDPHAPGHWGAGGAQGFAWPGAGIAVGYVTAKMAPVMGSSDRARALVAALSDCPV